MAKQKQDDGALPLGLLGEQGDADAVSPVTTETIDPASVGDQVAAEVGTIPEGDTSDEASDSALSQSNEDPSATLPPSDDAALDGGVLGLVLLDCLYGKCGEVKPFAAAQANELRVAGYIDTHPNAVAWAKG